MVNFQDAMVQVNQNCGVLWNDEGVYHIAKELQLLFPSELIISFLVWVPSTPQKPFLTV